MNKRLLLKPALLAALLLFGGCDTALRDLDSRFQEQPGDGIGSGTIDTTPDQNETQMLPPAAGTITEDENTTVGDIKVDAKNAYRVSVRFSDNYNEKGYFTRGEIGQIHFDITNLYTGEPANTDKIDEIVLEAQETIENNGTKTGKYFNFITYSGEEGPRYVIPKDAIKPSDNVAIKTGELSGTTNLIFKATVKLKDDKRSTYRLVVPMVIEKNKSASMAIVPIGTRYENGLFIEKFVIHVVDSYGNKAKDGTHIYTGVVNNPKLYSNAYNGATFAIPDKNPIDYNDTQTWTASRQIDDKTLPTNHWGDVSVSDYNKFYIRTVTQTLDENNNTVTHTSYTPSYYREIILNAFKSDTGTLDKNAKTFTLHTQNAQDNLINVGIEDTDTLVILANRKEHRPENLGGWDIKSIDSADTLSLVSYNFGNDVSDVSFVIGDEYRYDECRQTLMNAAASSFESTDVKDGLAYAELRYVPNMVGKTVFIYANTLLDDKRIGISRKVTLTGTGLGAQTLTCTNDKGTKPDCSMRFRMLQNDSGAIARKVYIAQPTNAGEPVYRYATASRTDCSGWTTVSIYGIDENKTASVKFGDFISDELILNQK